MSAEKPGISKGTRDFGPEQIAKRNYIFDIIKDIFEKFGFQPLETPAFENLSVLTGKYGEEGDKLLFKILNSGDFLKKTSVADYRQGAAHLIEKMSNKGLKYDLTVPFARYVVMNRGTLVFPFKRFQIQPVWRADRPQKGRYREFYQCDADVVGTDSLICEGEILAMMSEVFQKLGVENYTIKINNRKILTGISDLLGVKGKENQLFVIIDKSDKIGWEKVQEELTAIGMGRESIEKLSEIIALKNGKREKIEQLKILLTDSSEGQRGLEEIEEIFDLAEKMQVPLSKTVLDLSLARGLSYYTGAIFEAVIHNSDIGSVSGGGRYDNLTGVFGMEGTSGVGISFGVDRIYDALEKLSLFPSQKIHTVQLLFINFDKVCENACLPLLSKLRSGNIRAEIYPESAKLKKQMNYANRKNIPFVAMLGEEEQVKNMITLKNMESGEQQMITVDKMVEILKRN